MTISSSSLNLQVVNQFYSNITMHGTRGDPDIFRDVYSGVRMDFAKHRSQVLRLWMFARMSLGHQTSKHPDVLVMFLDVSLNTLVCLFLKLFALGFGCFLSENIRTSECSGHGRYLWDVGIVSQKTERILILSQTCPISRVTFFGPAIEMSR